MQLQDSVVVNDQKKFTNRRTEKTPMNGKTFTLETVIVGILMDASENNKTLPRHYSFYHIDSRTFVDITTNILGKMLDCSLTISHSDANVTHTGFSAKLHHDDPITVVNTSPIMLAHINAWERVG